ncbi:hypothetical protein [Vagococcus carniphilus]|uniref:hypothetical protein n=1 Tax=Vagococcus carniphilus TaxID=218144 RepID=UPI00288F43F6|nr:hypothetical protein [Vagococcus carniphilus]MDT2814282.1 hypothetical protein [Vagococcus carniphilus]MDT2864469.1 hypothetical protein [Vagococcus carniphilus]
MNQKNTIRIFILLSFLCVVGVFLMSGAFQSMAYWGNSMVWYWVGAVITYLIWLIGIILLVLAVTKKNGSYNLSTIVSNVIFLVLFTLFIVVFIFLLMLIISRQARMGF